MKIKMWQKELILVGLILSITPILHKSAWEFLGALAVLSSFAHAQISFRYTEQFKNNEIDYWKWSYRYFILKEVLWVIYFIKLGAWSALIGCALFLFYPFWRAYYLKYYKNA
jgi:hypothetical protein